jgi:NAD+ diphosphatase
MSWPPPLYLAAQVIMLVESPDGHRALLGRSRKFMPGMYTCLSGFIDQCEAVEEVREAGGGGSRGAGWVSCIVAHTWFSSRIAAC